MQNKFFLNDNLVKKLEHLNEIHQLNSFMTRKLG